MQIHFEILVNVGELSTQEARLISLGATKSPHQDPNDPGLIVMLDPAGHPFCIFENPDAVRFEPPTFRSIDPGGTLPSVMVVPQVVQASVCRIGELVMMQGAETPAGWLRPDAGAG
jgi:hypothetical protein